MPVPETTSAEAFERYVGGKFTMSRPEDADGNEIVFRPTRQEL